MTRTVGRRTPQNGAPAPQLVRDLAQRTEARARVAEAKHHRAPASADAVDPTVRTRRSAALGATDAAPGPAPASGMKQALLRTQASTRFTGPLFDAPLPIRQLPPLREALESAAIEAVSPAKLFPVPEAIVDRLASAKKILVIGHTPPDGDCVGSALGLSRMLRALGKEAHACVDDVIPGNLRKMSAPGELKRAAELDQDYDLVVVVDVAANNRIGRATEALARAPEVLVIDHHPVDATSAELGIDPKTPLTTWVVPTADSASLLVAGANEHLAKRFPEVKLSAKDRAFVALPLATGTYTDTDGFARPGASMPALQGYKHLVKKHLRSVGDEVEKVLEYRLPKLARDLLDPRLAGKKRSPRLPVPELAQRLEALQKKGIRLSADHAHDGSIALLSCPREVLALALDAARREDPHTSMNDVRGHILDALDRLPKSHALSALLFETEQGDVLVSTRSPEPGPALDLVKAVQEQLGGFGNGHLRMAGGRPPAPLSRTEPVVRQWMHQFQLERETRLRLAGNL